MTAITVRLWIYVSVFSLCSILAVSSVSSAEGFGQLAGRIVMNEHPPVAGKLELVINRNAGSGVNWTAVFLSTEVAKIDPTILPPKQSLTTITLAKGKVLPVVCIARVGGRFEVINKDVDASLIKVTGFYINEISFVKPGEHLSLQVDSPEMFPAVNIFEVDGPHREAWCVVPPSPYATVSNEKGEFAIERIPEGEYILRLWNPFVSFRRVLKQERLKVRITGDKLCELDPIVLDPVDAK